MRILLAVSGGIDSMYLAERAGDFFPGCSFAVAHCNFRLRGTESDADEAFVRDWCNRHALPLFVRGFDTQDFAAGQGISLEMAARELRYRWFAQLCAEEGFDAVAVAHQADDDAETMMLNLLRGCGSHGLRGMAAAAPIPYGDGNAQLLRPMLGIPRQEIREWMIKNGKGWREDRTNDQLDFKRNKLRHKVFPVFSTLNPDFLETLRKDRSRLAQVDDIAEDYFRTHKPDILKAEGQIDVRELLDRKHWKYLLYRLTEGKGLDGGHLEQLTKLLEGGIPDGTRHFGAWTLSRGLLIREPEMPEAPSEARWKIVDRETLSSVFPPAGTLYLDADRTGRPAFRSWQAGDWMGPLGMKGRKKLSDLFVDLKLTARDKARALVIPYPGEKDRVAALVGHRIDDTLKITSRTRHVLIVSLPE